jgi:hypothetical protein
MQDPIVVRFSLRELCNREPAAVLLRATNADASAVQQWLSARSSYPAAPLPEALRSLLEEKYSLEAATIDALIKPLD